MDTKNHPQLKDESTYPDDQILKDVLGRSFSAYSKLLQYFAEHGLEYQWRYYKDGNAWLCKVQKKKKTIIWMSAWKSFFKAAIYVPVRLEDEVYQLPLSNERVEIIKGTKNVGKSKPCIFDIRNQKALKELYLLIQFKMAAK